MNSKQRIILSIGVAVIVLIGLFPPSKLACPKFTGPWLWWEKAMILVLHNSIYNLRIRYVKLLNLFVEWSIVALAAGGLIYAFRDRNAEGKSSE
jgi:hypothetical protein